MKYVAFLRAINVGGHTVKMDRLRALFEEQGFSNVETFIASGNVIFDTKRRDPVRIERDIEAHLHSALGYEVMTFIRTPAELAATVSHQPPGREGGALYIGFVREPITDAIGARIRAFRTDIDEFDVSGRELYWRCYGRMSDTKFSNAVLEKTLKGPATMRNITTVTKLAARYAGQ